VSPGKKHLGIPMRRKADPAVSSFPAGQSKGARPWEVLCMHSMQMCTAPGLVLDLCARR
jgi:hypothetical protein